MNADADHPTLLNQLQALEIELHHPGVRCSSTRLQALLHPDFREVGRSGARYTRDTVIDHLKSQVTPPEVHPSDFAVQALSDACALLTYRSAHRAPDGDFTMHVLRSSIWLKTGSSWQLVYHQGTPSPPPT